MDEKKYEEMYEALMNFEHSAHEKNKKRVKAGMVCIIVIPIVFLILMFLTGSSRPVFLVLWIISLYGIAVYLIGIEYADHKLQENLAKMRGEEKEAEPLIGSRIENVEETLRGVRTMTLDTLFKRKDAENEEAVQELLPGEDSEAEADGVMTEEEGTGPAEAWEPETPVTEEKETDQAEADESESDTEAGDWSDEEHH